MRDGSTAITLHEGHDVRTLPRERSVKTLVELDARVPDRGAPKALGGYELVAKIGDQGSAEIFLAVRRAAHGIVRRATIKYVARWRPDYERARAILLDEATVTACFSHPNLSALLDAGEDAQGAFIALEHTEGVTLEKLSLALRKRHAALPVELCCLIIAEALRGMSWAHSLRGPDNRPLGVVLRDRTPANLLVSRTGSVKLTDFSLALTRARRQHETEVGVVKGAFAYLSPEYVAGDVCTVRSDIYALGVMFFELLSGRACFAGANPEETVAQIIGRGVAWKELEREGISPKLMEIVSRATNPCASGRYGSALEMLDLLEEEMSASTRAATPTTLARVLARHGLYEGTGHQTIDQSKYAPELRIIRGASIRVVPPPLPAEDDSLSLTESEIGGLFGDDDELDDNVEAFEIRSSMYRPPIAAEPASRPDSTPLVIVRSPVDSGSTQILVFAALLAIALFAAIVFYPA